MRTASAIRPKPHCLQGRAANLGFVLGATPQMLEDTRRGLLSYDALRTQLQESRFAKAAGLRDVSGTVIKIEPLSFEEVFVLLQQLKGFMEESLHRVGAERFSTPREIIRDFKPSEAPAEPDESAVPEPVETTAASTLPATADQQFKEFKL